MDYKVNILTKCENEEEASIVIAAALSAVMDNNQRNRPGYNLIVRKLRRLPVVSPVWNQIGRHERFERKLNT